RSSFVGPVDIPCAQSTVDDRECIRAAALDYPRGGRMNRRGFFGAMIAPVGAIIAAKVLPVGYVEHAKSKLKRYTGLQYHTPTHSARAYYGGRQWHQEQLSKWLANKVDEATFNTITRGDLDGKV
ncbi:hypothetical protein LCGC14_2382200, partial [marine sediment metagenome]